MEADLEKLQRALADAIAGLSAEELTWHPEGKWCAVEVMEHLYLTYTGTIKGFERVLEKGNPLATAKTWRHRFATFVVTRLGHVPQGRKSPPTAQPKGLPREIVLAEFAAKIGEMDSIIARCEKQFGPGVKLLDHPFLGALSGAEWRKFHLVHGLHHAKQICALRTS